MTKAPCPMASLVEAKRDRRLSALEEASLSRHLLGCLTCSVLDADLTNLANAVRLPPPTPLDHRRGRLRLLREAALPRTEAPDRPRIAWAFAALGAVAAIAISVIHPMRSPAPPQLDHLAPVLRPVARTETTLTPEVGTLFSQTFAEGTEVVQLETGSVWASVRPLRPWERFVVRTKDAEVEVRGTVFHVAAEHHRIRAVHVIEGAVEVRYHGGLWHLRDGQAWTPDKEALPFPPKNQVALSTSTAFAPSSPVLDQRGSPKQIRPSARMARSESIPTGAASTQRTPTNARANSPSEATQLLAEGVRMADQGDFHAAAERLQRFSTEHPNDQRAEDAAFLAIVALKRAGRTEEACRAARDYLARYPHGYRRVEAQGVASSGAPEGGSRSATVKDGP